MARIKLPFYYVKKNLLVGLATGMISTNVLNILVCWVDALWLFQLYTLVNGLEIIEIRFNKERAEKESVKNVIG